MDKKQLIKFEELGQEFDADNRLIYLETEIDITTPSFLKQRVNIISHLTKDSTSPITVELTSYGGDAFGAFATIDVIRQFPMPINMAARGAVMSAGALLLVATTGNRSITENTYVMLHSASGALIGNTDEILIEAENLKNITNKTFELLERYSKKPIKFWEQKCKKNFYLTPEECLEFGIVDEVIRINVTERY
jgi:ATP-dependent Clp protease protease subunit